MFYLMTSKSTEESIPIVFFSIHQQSHPAHVYIIQAINRRMAENSTLYTNQMG
eukprot:GAHX01008478.1.p1 GENE.GAHX01008478.1~~GAHX01008478.1.p1  ORF type:complete len:53 (-),score=2.86 GAHX01008478.1:93-251(-)